MEELCFGRDYRASAGGSDQGGTDAVVLDFAALAVVVDVAAQEGMDTGLMILWSVQVVRGRATELALVQLEIVGRDRR